MPIGEEILFQSNNVVNIILIIMKNWKCKYIGFLFFAGVMEPELLSKQYCNSN